MAVAPVVWYSGVLWLRLGPNPASFSTSTAAAALLRGCPDDHIEAVPRVGLTDHNCRESACATGAVNTPGLAPTLMHGVHHTGSESSPPGTGESVVIDERHSWSTELPVAPFPVWLSRRICHGGSAGVV